MILKTSYLKTFLEVFKDLFLQVPSEKKNAFLMTHPNEHHHNKYTIIKEKSRDVEI